MRPGSGLTPFLFESGNESLPVGHAAEAARFSSTRWQLLCNREEA